MAGVLPGRRTGIPLASGAGQREYAGDTRDSGSIAALRGDRAGGVFSGWQVHGNGMPVQLRAERYFRTALPIGHGAPGTRVEGRVARTAVEQRWEGSDLLARRQSLANRIAGCQAGTAMVWPGRAHAGDRAARRPVGLCACNSQCGYLEDRFRRNEPNFRAPVPDEPGATEPPILARREEDRVRVDALGKPGGMGVQHRWHRTVKTVVIRRSVDGNSTMVPGWKKDRVRLASFGAAGALHGEQRRWQTTIAPDHGFGRISSLLVARWPVDLLHHRSPRWGRAVQDASRRREARATDDQGRLCCEGVNRRAMAVLHQSTRSQRDLEGTDQRAKRTTGEGVAAVWLAGV